MRTILACEHPWLSRISVSHAFLGSIILQPFFGNGCFTLFCFVVRCRLIDDPAGGVVKVVTHFVVSCFMIMEILMLGVI